MAQGHAVGQAGEGSAKGPATDVPLPIEWPPGHTAALLSGPRGYQQRRVADLRAMAEARRRAGALSATGRVQLGDGRAWTPEQAVRAGIDAGTVRSLTPAAVLAAGRAVLDGVCSADELAWAVRHGWAWLWCRGSAPTPDVVLPWALEGLLVLRRLVQGREEPPAEWYDGNDVLERMTVQAVRSVGAGAGPWIAEWARTGGGLQAPFSFRAWMRSHAGPWQRAMPAGADRWEWVCEARRYAAAGYRPREARRLAVLPAGHPERPSRAHLEVLAALRR
jgi:hypothetical protein